jgi:hypothetical protein
VRCGISARAVHRWGPGCKEIRKQLFLSSSQTAKAPLHISLSLSLSLSLLLFLKEGHPLLGISIGALLGPSEHIPGLSVRFSTMSSEYFFAYLTLSQIFSKKVIRV